MDREDAMRGRCLWLWAEVGLVFIGDFRYFGHAGFCYFGCIKDLYQITLTKNFTQNSTTEIINSSPKFGQPTSHSPRMSCHGKRRAPSPARGSVEDEAEALLRELDKTSKQKLAHPNDVLMVDEVQSVFTGMKEVTVRYFCLFESCCR